jgi:integrase
MCSSVMGRGEASCAALRRQEFGKRPSSRVCSATRARQGNGAALDPETTTRYVRQAVKKSMLPQIRLHDLRHTHATLALQAGIHPKVVSDRLGHANISITLDTYSHAIPAMQEEAAALIAELVFASKRVAGATQGERRRARSGASAAAAGWR